MQEQYSKTAQPSARGGLGKRAWMTAVCLLGLAAGCADDPVSRITDPPNRVRSLYSTVSGTIVEIMDEFDGVTYTFNSQDRTVTHSDGRVLDLTADQNLTVMNVFYGNANADLTVADVDQLCTPEYPCADLSSIPGEHGSVDALGDVAPSIILRKTGESPRTHRAAGQRFGIRVSGGVPLQSKKGRKKGDFTAMTTGNCGDIAVALRDAGTSYRYNRVNLVRDGFWSGVFVWVQNKLRGQIPVGGALAAKLVGDAAINQEKRVALTILGSLWNSYDCSNRQIRVGPSYQSGGGGSGTPVLSCRVEYWEISIDGGNTWDTIDVQVCEYAAE